MNGKTEYYCYRIEFQLRGLPHAHGVIWLKKEVIQKYILHTDNGIEYTSDIIELIDHTVCWQGEVQKSWIYIFKNLQRSTKVLL